VQDEQQSCTCYSPNNKHIIIIIIIIIIIVQLAPFQRVAPLADNNLQSGLSSASLVASSTIS